VGLDASAELSNNTAGTDGGGAALLDGATFEIDFVACPPTCQAAMRSNAVCNVEWWVVLSAGSVRSC
jgi:hypothetical protein